MFTKLDANSGFWQIPLTTFITPFGWYHFRRLSFGISSAPEHFQRRMSEVLSGLSGTVCLMDDILVHGTTREEHDERLRLVLQRLSNLGMTLNSEKCAVEFLGHVIDSQTRSKQSLCHRRICDSWQRQRHPSIPRHGQPAHQTSEITQPTRELLVKENAWLRGEIGLTELITASPVLALFDPNLETVLSADASSHGLRRQGNCSQWPTYPER